MGVLSLLDNRIPVINGNILIIQELVKVFPSLPVTAVSKSSFSSYIACASCWRFIVFCLVLLNSWLLWYFIGFNLMLEPWFWMVFDTDLHKGLIIYFCLKFI